VGTGPDEIEDEKAALKSAHMHTQKKNEVTILDWMEELFS
jgi:hypothetical protein